MRRWSILLIAVGAPQLAAAQTSPICTDRPAKANSVCTVSPGMVQIETSAIGWSLIESGDSRIELLTAASSFAKLGLTDRSDLQIGFTPFARVDVESGGARDRVSGFGDVIVRYKHRLTSPEAPVQLALIPLLKLPTAGEGLGNGAAEGGIAVPISFSLGGPVTMTLGPELDLLADADGDGRHLALVNLVNLSTPVAPRLTMIGELWTNFNFDPAGTVKQASADAALAYAISDDLQLDAGVNVGLTPDTPDFEVYAGVAIRF